MESCPYLNTDTFLNALARITASRGSPITIYIDNGKTFVGASNELKRCLKQLDKNKIENKLAVKEIERKFNPPFDPDFGGAWERLIQITKRTTSIILGSKKLTLYLFNTILSATETMLNSRPLTNVADITDNEEPLYPNHFKIQRPFINLPPRTFDYRQPLRFEDGSQQQLLLNHISEDTIKRIIIDPVEANKMELHRTPAKKGRCVDFERSDAARNKA